MLKEFGQAKAELLDWGDIRGFKTKFLRTLASHYLTELLTSHQFHEEAISKDGERYRKYADNPIKHPLATKDKDFIQLIVERIYLLWNQTKSQRCY